MTPPTLEELEALAAKLKARFPNAALYVDSERVIAVVKELRRRVAFAAAHKETASDDYDYYNGLEDAYGIAAQLLEDALKGGE